MGQDKRLENDKKKQETNEVKNVEPQKEKHD